MTRLIASLALLAALTASPAVAQATCWAEFKAKRDNPLTLFYDIAQVEGPCTPDNAEHQLREMLAAEGLTLLKILSVRRD